VVSLKPIPDEEDLRIYYNEAYSIVAEAYLQGTQRNSPPILRELGERFPWRGKLLEVRCSYGFFLEAAQRDGWQTAGIELDDGAARYGREKLGLKIFSGTLESELGKLEPPYDAIATFHIVEHVRDPIGFLQRCRKLLREGGALILKTPNVASWIAKRTGAYWEWLCPPAHIHLFSPRALELALEKSGFRVEKIWSRRGDANNNLFQLVHALGKHVVSRKNGAAGGNGRRNWSDRWYVQAVRTASGVIYYLPGLVVDSWLGKKRLQPELVAIARV
jgi:SAM-dependent methyltransferase